MALPQPPKIALIFYSPKAKVLHWRWRCCETQLRQLWGSCEPCHRQGDPPLPLGRMLLSPSFPGKKMTGDGKCNTGYIYASAPTRRGAGIGSYLPLNRERGPWPRSGSGQLVFPVSSQDGLEVNAIWELFTLYVFPVAKASADWGEEHRHWWRCASCPLRRCPWCFFGERGASLSEMEAPV